jgi:Kelch motif
MYGKCLRPPSRRSLVELGWMALLSQAALGAAPSPRYNHSAIWTGSEMIVWGGNAADGSALDDGARYDPGSRTWTPISTLNAPVSRYDHIVVWTGTEMILRGGLRNDFNYANDGARYHLASNAWLPMTTNGAFAARAHGTNHVGALMTCIAKGWPRAEPQMPHQVLRRVPGMAHPAPEPVP